MKKINNELTIGTHNGIFHSDEVIAISILKLLIDESTKFKVIRSRNIELLKSNCNILIDIGGGIFDHHQKGGNGKRSNGTSYASAGLIWKAFGPSLIQKLSSCKLNTNEIKMLWEKIDFSIVQQIDKEDNGEGKNTNIFNFIESFLPSWNEIKPEYDKQFNKVLFHASNILKQLIEKFIYEELGNKEIKQRIKNKKARIDNILIIPSQTITWINEIIAYNTKNSVTPIDFVVFPYPDGGYALQCVPCSLENKFSQRIPLPNSWAGETYNLPKITGINSAILCHKGKFFARAGNIIDAILMCQIATNIFNCAENMENKSKVRKKE